MTPNKTLSIVNALKHERPDDYYENTATIEWPLGPGGEAFPIGGGFFAAVVFKDGPNLDDRQGVRPLPRGRGLARALSRLLGRAHAAADAEAARSAVLARPERPAPHGCGDAGRVAPDAIRLRHGYGRLAARSGLGRRDLGEGGPSHRRPRASAPSRRSTRRSPGSSRSWRVSGHAVACPELLLSRRSFWRRSARGRRPRGVVGEGVLPPGGRGGQGDHRRLRAGDRQEVELVFHEQGGCWTRLRRRSRPAGRPTSRSASH